MGATLRDVARLAGTSVSAASEVLNGNGRHNIRVGETTRERIRSVARQLGYAPNPHARSLVTKKTGALGLVFPYSQAFIDREPFSTQVMAGVFETAVRQRYNLLLYTAAGNDWNAADESTLVDGAVDGLILVLPMPGSPVIARCRREGLPYVALVYTAESPEVFAVNADEFAGGRLAAEHLIALGHRRIAHLMGDQVVASSLPRQCGYLAALKEAGIVPDPRLTVSLPDYHSSGYQAMQPLLDLSPDERPTAVFAFNDPSAESAVRAAEERGLRVPNDLAVVGFDDTRFAAMTRPPLTSVHMPISEMAARATALLIDQAEGREVAERQPVFPVSLTVRQSCGASLPRPQ